MAISARSLALDGLTAPIRPLVVAVCGLLASSTSTTLGYPREVRVDALELVVACDAPEREARTVAPRCAVVVEQAARGAVARETAWGLEVEAVAREASASVTAWGFDLSVAYVDTNLTVPNCFNTMNCDARAIFMVSKTF